MSALRQKAEICPTLPTWLPSLFNLGDLVLMRPVRARNCKTCFTMRIDEKVPFVRGLIHEGARVESGASAVQSLWVFLTEVISAEEISVITSRVFNVIEPNWFEAGL